MQIARSKMETTFSWSVLVFKLHDLSVGFPLSGLRDFDSTLHEAALVSIFLRSMAHFGDMNMVYSRFFPESRPAARVCVQLGLDELCACRLAVIIPLKGEPQ